MLIAASLLLGTPFFIVFGSLSDRIGRKPIIMAGCLLAALTYFPLFKALTHYANPALEAAHRRSAGGRGRRSGRVLVPVRPGRAQSTFTSSCDIAKSAWRKRGVPYDNEAAPRRHRRAVIRSATRRSPRFDGAAGSSRRRKAQGGAAFDKDARRALTAAGYPAKADPAQINKPMVRGPALRCW